MAENSQTNGKLSEGDLSRLKIIQLKDELRKRHLKTTGNKIELLLRLKEAIDFERRHGTDDDNDEDDAERNDDESSASETEDEEDEENETARTADKHRRGGRCVLSFKDVDESFETFSGDDNRSITKWLEDFEGQAEVYNWSDMHKLAYVRRLLRGSAKIFINFEKSHKTWAKMKKALLEEFRLTVDTFKIHQELSQRKRKKDESLQSYTYRMIELAAQANVDTRATIQYVIAGIEDEPVNKTMLYGAKTIGELKEALKQYDDMTKETKTKKEVVKLPEKKKDEMPKTQEKKQLGRDRQTKTGKACYNCGGKDHLSMSCPDKEKGIKCFKCSGYGHIAAKCPGKQNSTVAMTTSLDRGKPLKEVSIADQKYMTIIDTGSDLSLMDINVYKKLNLQRLEGERVEFQGLGARNNKTLGLVVTDVDIDGERHKIRFHVVKCPLLKSRVLIGMDFLNTVRLCVVAGEITISKINEEIPKDDADIPEIFKINDVEDEELLDLSHVVKPDVSKEITNIVSNYQPIKTREIGVSMRLILHDEVPVYQRARRLSLAENTEVREQIDSWLENDIIRPSESEYASPIVLVPKKNNEVRICIDYRNLNKKIIKDRYPLPLIEDQLDRLQGAKMFTSLDLKNGFFHVEVAEESRKYTAFITPFGQYEFLKMPFGICNAPSVFQRYINAVFRELIVENVVLIYMDDLIIPTQGIEDGLENFRRVIQIAAEAGLMFNWSKCKFLQTRIEYLGHVIEGGNIGPSESKIKAVMKFPEPKNAHDVRSFLGLTGYFRKFIPSYAQLARPLSDLLREAVAFVFGDKQKEAFDRLKTILSRGPVLRLFRPRAETELHTDASKYGYGAILLQKDSEDGAFHPVYYASGKTTPAEEKYTSYELEVLAIVKALKKFRIHLLAIPFKIVTDCCAFTMTMKKRDLCVRVARWALQLEEFNYQVQHRPGKNMRHVDALSRNPLPESLLIDENDDSLIARFKEQQGKDEEIKRMYERVMRNECDGYVIKNGLLYKSVSDDILLVVPKAMQNQVIRLAHEHGHFGVNKTEAILRTDYWFAGMREKLERVVKCCINCIVAERKGGKHEGFLNTIDKGDTPLDTYHIDHLGLMTPTPKKYKYLFVVVDAFSKFVWLYPAKSTDAAEVLDRLKKQAAIIGNPRHIISDRGTAFTSGVFQEYCKVENIQHLLISTGIPRGNGQVERVNRTVIALLTKLSAPKPHEWYRHVSTAQSYLNATPNRSTGKTPFNLLFGTHMRIKEDLKIRELIEREWIYMFEEERDEIRQEAKQNIRKIQEENHRNFNKKCKEAVKYRIGNLVAIRRTQFGLGLKLSPKFLGPYKVVKVMRHNRYIVEKVGEHEGPRSTSTSADNMKSWEPEQFYDEEWGSEEKQHLRADVLSGMAECSIGED